MDTEDDGALAEQPDTESHEQHDYQTLANGFLTPRHRRLCQLASLGTSNAKIAEELGYCQSRISILLKNPHLAAEIRRLQDKIFEATIKDRLKGLSDAALNNVEMILTDRTNRVKVSEKADMSKWLIEKLDGKAVQTNDIGTNTLGVLLDRLDAQKSVSRGTKAVSPVLEMETKQITATSAVAKDEESLLEEWIVDFNASGT
jgi:hypothetical protein